MSNSHKLYHFFIFKPKSSLYCRYLLINIGIKRIDQAKCKPRIKIVQPLGMNPVTVPSVFGDTFFVKGFSLMIKTAFSIPMHHCAVAEKNLN